MWSSVWGGGMSWAGTAPYLAARAIGQQKAKHVLNVFPVAWATQRASMTGGPGEVHATQAAKQNLEVPFGWFPQPVYFATIMRRHMLEFGTTEAQFGAVAVACRRHANLNPGAVMHEKTMTIDDYLASPYLADPLRLFDSCLICDGGAAYVTTSVERATRPAAAAGGRPRRGRGALGERHALEPAARLHQHAAGLLAPRPRSRWPGSPEGRRRPHRVRPVHRRVAHADRGHGVLPEGRGRPLRRGRHVVPRRGQAAVQPARRAAVARVRPRHRPRRRDREAAARDGERAGARARRSRSTAATPARTPARSC